MDPLRDTLSAIRERVAERQRQREAGLLPDEPPTPDIEPDCALCGDFKWLTVDVPVGDPNFGAIVPCECVIASQSTDLAERLRRHANLGNRERMTFESFQPVPGEAVSVAREYANSPEGWLVLAGPNGAGKTHLAASIVNRMISDGRQALFVFVPDLLDDLRLSYAPDAGISYSDLFEQVLAAPVLVLDGLGAHSSTAWATEKLQQLFNRRAGEELPTIVTTAAPLEALDPYLSSRLVDARLSRLVWMRSDLATSSGSEFAAPARLVARMRFDTFLTPAPGASSSESASLEAARGGVQRFTRSPDGFVVLYGDTGVGKTHLAVAAASALANTPAGMRFVSMPRLLDRLRATYEPGAPVPFSRLFSLVLDAPVLMLDDFGRETSNDWSKDKTAQIVFHRHAQGLPTLVATHLDVIGSSGAVMSRLADPSAGVAFRMDAPDFRGSHR